MRKLSQVEVQNRINEIHGPNTFVLQENYVNARTKVVTVHTKCNNTWKADVNSLLRGHGCPNCSNNQKKSQKEFSEQISKITNGEYEVVGQYTGNHEKVAIKHLECGSIFEMEANAFLRGQRCPAERYVNTAKSNTIPLEIAQKRMFEETDGEYEIVGNYKGLNPRKNGKADIVHKTCGHIFKVEPSRIINHGSGCPKCSESHGEKYVANFLNEFDFEYKREFRIKECRNVRPLPFDFAIFDNGELKYLIEYDGEQHFKPKFGKKHFEQTKRNDEIKNLFCEKNNIDLIRIPYKRSYTSKSAKKYVYDVLSNMLIPSQA